MCCREVPRSVRDDASGGLQSAHAMNGEVVPSPGWEGTGEARTSLAAVYALGSASALGRLCKPRGSLSDEVMRGECQTWLQG